MTELICVLAGFSAGAIIGVFTMCWMQIKRINHYERRIAKLKKQLGEARGNDTSDFAR